MSGKKNLVPFSPVYEPLVFERYCDRYLADQSVMFSRFRGAAGSAYAVLADDIEEEARAMRSADLYYARTDMVSLAVAAMLDGDVPDVPAPSDSGFLLLEDGVRPLGVDGPDTVTAYGLVWWHVNGGLQVSLMPDVLLSQLGVRIPSPRHRSQVDVRRDATAFRKRDVHGMYQEDALLRAMFALWAEPHVVTSSAPKVSPLDRVAKRVSEQAKRVRIVDVRERVDDAPERDPLGRKHRPYDHRFIVSGHWREQPCGHNRSERRRKWIAPYVKGPADRPLVLKDTVRVWRS